MRPYRETAGCEPAVSSSQGSSATAPGSVCHACTSRPRPYGGALRGRAWSLGAFFWRRPTMRRYPRIPLPAAGDVSPQTAVDARATSWGSTTTRLNPLRAPDSIRSSISSAARLPSSCRDQLTVVSGTRSRSPSAMSPAPTTAMSSGTRRPASQIAFIAPIAAGSLAANTASTARPHREQLLHRAIAVRFHEPAADDPFAAALDAVRLAAPRASLSSRRLACTIGGPAMCAIALRPCAIRCVGRQLSDLLVVGQHAVALDGGMIVAVDHHQPDAASDRGAAAGRCCPRRSPTRGRCRRPGAGAASRARRAPCAGSSLELHSSRPYPRALRDRLEPGDDLDEERVHQIGDDDAERVGAAEREAARDGVGLVAELGDLGEHARARGMADVAAIVEDLGDGRDGHAELAGDPLHRGRCDRASVLDGPGDRTDFSVKVT